MSLPLLFQGYAGKTFMYKQRPGEKDLLSESIMCP